MASENEPTAPPGINTKVSNPARVYDYWLGGKDNFPVDREAAEAFIKVFPGIITGVRMNRAFLGRAGCSSAGAKPLSVRRRRRV